MEHCFVLVARAAIKMTHFLWFLWLLAWLLTLNSFLCFSLLKGWVKIGFLCLLSYVKQPDQHLIQFSSTFFLLHLCFFLYLLPLPLGWLIFMTRSPHPKFFQNGKPSLGSYQRQSQDKPLLLLIHVFLIPEVIKSTACTGNRWRHCCVRSVSCSLLSIVHWCGLLRPQRSREERLWPSLETAWWYFLTHGSLRRASHQIMLQSAVPSGLMGQPRKGHFKETLKDHLAPRLCKQLWDVGNGTWLSQGLVGLFYPMSALSGFSIYSLIFSVHQAAQPLLIQ